jgi:RimJ/RimL family protein N-acetyltransferase
MIPPILTTDRLVLRPPALADFELWAEIECTERGQYIGGPFTRDEAHLDFTQAVASWLLRGYGLWSLDDRAARNLLGFIVIHHEWGDPEPEIGWLLGQAAEGHGYATEGAKAALAWAWQNTGLDTLVSYVDPASPRSGRVAERLGAVRDTAAEAELLDHFGALHVWRHRIPS